MALIDKIVCCDQISTPSFWDNVLPREISFLKLPFYDQYRSRSFHARTTRGSWEMQKILHDFNVDLVRSDIYHDPSQAENQRDYVHRLLLRLEGDVFCHFEGPELTVYAPTLASSIQETERFLKDYVTEKSEPTPRFYLLNARQSGFEIESVNLTKPFVMSAQDLELHYGEPGVSFENALVDCLRNCTSGAVILRGEPGTGKTSFIRHVISKLNLSHKFYYLPLSACRFLASPDMVDFWLRQSRLTPDLGKVVVLEDAEELLMHRQADNQSKVSSLLNAADGLLGEFLRLTLILTVNCKIDKLDPAITRPGRLLAFHEFNRLGREQALRLAETQSLKLPVQDDYSLAEIYCRRTNNVSEPRRHIGFAS